MAIGFKASWHKKERRKKESTDTNMLPAIIPGSAVFHVLELQMKIQEHEEFILTAKFTRLSKQGKSEFLSSYRFLVVTLASINLPQNSANAYTEYMQNELANAEVGF